VKHPTPGVLHYALFSTICPIASPKNAQNKQNQQEATTRVNQIKKTNQNKVGVSEGKKKHTR